MGIYIYQHPETEDIIEIVQGMNDEHSYIDEKGIKWNRIFTKPQASIDSKIDAYDEAAFIKKTGNMKGTLGNMQELSKELSAKRGGGDPLKDPIKQKHMKNWEDKRNKDRERKIIHPDKKPKEFLI